MLDPAAGMRVAAALGAASPAPSERALNDALVAAADRLGISAARLGEALLPLLAQWKALGATPDQVAASLLVK